MLNNIDRITELEKQWLFELYTSEILEVEGAISNENLWLKGSDDETEQLYHSQNISDDYHYIVILKSLISELTGKEVE